MTITASAPGKLVLFGDHAAVYGRPCLVTAVDLRFYVAAMHSGDTTTEIDTPELRAYGETHRVDLKHQNAGFRKETAFVEAALARFIEHYPSETGYRISTDGPQFTFGLGSSSAITVATLAACAALEGIELSPRTVFDLAYAAVLDVQGTGSGIDVAAAAYGGTIYYADRGAVIEPLSIGHLPIVIAYSGAKVSTTSLIEHVADLRSRQPDVIDTLLATLGDLSAAARSAMMQSDWRSAGELANIHQGILDAFGVNTPRLAALIFAARAAGALGAKLSGAGGGDCIFALVDPSTQPRVEATIEHAGGLVVRLENGAQGVRIEDSTSSHKL